MKKRGKLVLILIALCIIIAVLPLVIIRDSEFGGADGAAEEIITEIKQDYEPWANSLIAPPGGETESLLFSLQAGIGCIILGYGFGYLIARKKYA